MFTICPVNTTSIPQKLRGRYENQADETCVFSCSDGDIKMSQFGVYPSDYFRSKMEDHFNTDQQPRPVVFRFSTFRKAVVEIYTNSLHGIGTDGISLYQLSELMEFLFQDFKTDQSKEDFSEFDWELLKICFSQLYLVPISSKKLLPVITLLVSYDNDEAIVNAKNLIEANKISKKKMDAFLSQIFLGDSISKIFHRIVGDRVAWIKLQSKKVYTLMDETHKNRRELKREKFRRQEDTVSEITDVGSDYSEATEQELNTVFDFEGETPLSKELPPARLEVEEAQEPDLDETCSESEHLKPILKCNSKPHVDGLGHDVSISQLNNTYAREDEQKRIRKVSFRNENDTFMVPKNESKSNWLPEFNYPLRPKPHVPLRPFRPTQTTSSLEYLLKLNRNAIIAELPHDIKNRPSSLDLQTHKHSHGLYEFIFKRFTRLEYERKDLNTETIFKKKPDYFDEWMKNSIFYSLAFGIHKMQIPKSGRYQLVLSGYGRGDSKGCKITIVKPLVKGQAIKFFIRLGVFLFDEEDELIAIAGGAGWSQAQRKESSASLSSDNAQNKYFGNVVPAKNKGYEFVDILSNRDDWPFYGDGFLAGSRSDGFLLGNYEGGSSYASDVNAVFEHVSGPSFFEVKFLSC